MIKVKINGKKEIYDYKITGQELLQSINRNSKCSCVAIELDGKVFDLSTVIEQDCEARFILSSSPEGLEIIRHDAAHVLAHAVKELYPKSMIAIGPVIENGFYYDFANPEPFTEEHLKKIQFRMQEIVKAKLPITRKIISREEALKFFQECGEKYKVEIINSLPVVEKEEISLYTQGNFTDLCKGPHSPNTGFISAFKLTKVAGSYWRGNSNKQTLQRIYGTAWSSKEELKQYLSMLAEAEKRDHRKIGKQCSLFHFHEEAQGSIFWHHKGWELFQKLIKYIRYKQNKSGYYEINTPEIMDKSLWERSGHWDKFRENMFIVNANDKVYAMRPMNCPGGIQIYNQGLKSYKDLPLRFAEFGKVYRLEASGALHGLMRARAFTQDDAHIFCTTEQMIEECRKVCNLISELYSDFGFDNIRVKFSNRPDKRIGSDLIWDQAENALLEAVQKEAIPYTLNKGEGAFYGPKLEFVLRDAIGRDWQLGTLQVDFNLPERFNMTYIAKNGEKHRPVILHRALFGSIERFLGILLEHYSGHLPLWLSPVQVVIIPLTDDLRDYADKVLDALIIKGIKGIIDNKNEKITYKIRKHSLDKIPIIAVVGQNEKANQSISVRKLGNKNQEVLELSDFVDKLVGQIKIKGVNYN